MEIFNGLRGSRQTAAAGNVACKKLCAVEEIVARLGFPTGMELPAFPEQMVRADETYAYEDEDGRSWLSHECVLKCPTCHGESSVELIRNNVMEVWTASNGTAPTLKRCTQQEPFDLVVTNRADRHGSPPGSSAD